ADGLMLPAAAFIHIFWHHVHRVTVMSKQHILLLPGDGIGLETVREAEKIIRWFNDVRGLSLTTSTALIGGAAIDATGKPLPDETLAAAKEADAILMGAVGGPKWDVMDFA